MVYIIPTLFILAASSSLPRYPVEKNIFLQKIISTTVNYIEAQYSLGTIFMNPIQILLYTI